LSFLSLAEHVAETLDIGPGTRVFEVDCGPGEFLLPLHQNGFIVGGIDADPEAIKTAIASMPDGLFQTGTATALDPGVPWHVVVCRSFAAAPDLDYMRGLLARMFAKATHAIELLDVPDERRHWMLHALAEIGANAIQMEEATSAVSNAPDRFNVFARV
jgi:2-polyprenyl-3-methyl-5-hydroxy-6-metoxy-1,4-benzoquinol methylase